MKRSIPAAPFFIYLNLNSMKNLCLFFALMFITISCDDETAGHTDDGKDDWENRIVFWDPDIIVTDANNNNLFQNGVYNLDKLSLIATDEHWNDLYINGNRVSDMEGIVEILNILHDADNNPIGVSLGFGYRYERNSHFITSYYKLQYDDEKYDYIKTVVDTTDNNYILKTIFYNGDEYLASKVPPMEVIKSE